MSRTPIIAANWKMNIGPKEAKEFLAALKNELCECTNAVDKVIVPPFVTIPAVMDTLNGCKCIGVGAQDVSDRDNGAFTGEISTTMLNELGCTYVVLGHSERRQYHGETNAYINRKIKKALAAGIIPIYCIGETLEQREGGQLETVLKSQVVEGLEGLTADEVAGIVIAYEPVWAIGTGKTASAADAQAAHAFIRGVLAETFGAEAADKVRLQYGGSVKPANAAELMSQPDIDGALVGGAALKADSFAAIIKAAV
ncbi:MAG: triose-phosphate isomerase [Akkermansia sp.]|nr:triose-phosphate isomerase [Akkermansia sp.]